MTQTVEVPEDELHEEVALDPSQTAFLFTGKVTTALTVEGDGQRPDG
jgi:hypothetical protein